VIDCNATLAASNLAPAICTREPARRRVHRSGRRAQHIAGELFKFMAGVDLTHAPYKGTTPAVTDLVAGQVQIMFDGV
jgi:tripartite-type tricarboxylate transporter receptor subunit TctC